MKLGMVSIFVYNPIEAFKFYTEVLGFEEKMYMPEAQVAIVTAPDGPDGPLILLEPTENPIAKNYHTQLYEANIPCMVFSVENIDEEYNRLKQKGVLFTKTPQKTEYGSEAIFDDTCGNLIQLHQL
ncbi:VOC family protein [Chitinophaga niabensis]|uniref:VOC family protein n=1 Tax=Chitinophaga niabensis TaxID=536979 RepID=UPI0031BAF529